MCRNIVLRHLYAYFRKILLKIPIFRPILANFCRFLRKIHYKSEKYFSKIKINGENELNMLKLGEIMCRNNVLRHLYAYFRKIFLKMSNFRPIF